MSILRILTACLLLAASGAWAQSVVSKNPADIPAGEYSLDPQHAKILFGVSHYGFSTYYGEFSGAKGTLELQNQKPETSTLTIKVPVGAISTTNSFLDKELMGPNWLDASNFPAMVFKSTAIKVTGKDSAQVTGDLTIHGVTKPTTLTVKLNGGGMSPQSKKFTVGFEVSGKIKRSDFGITSYIPAISDEVQLIISAPFEKED
jgi:polyisoprenoid-binding protein YceI